MRQRRLLFAAYICASTLCLPSVGQTLPATTLKIDVQNIVIYVSDVSDPNKATTSTGVAPDDPSPINFDRFVAFGDIVSVNGQAVKGTWVLRGQSTNLSTTPQPGQAIADVTRLRIIDQVFELLQPDGRPIGTIMAAGFFGGPSPPGALAAAGRDNVTITGGTGAFLGIRGQVNRVPLTSNSPLSFRAASITEDPSKRRAFGGGSDAFVMHVLPAFQPEIGNTPNGPAIFHTDFSPVTAARPARAGEQLIAAVTGLGPTRPSIDPGTPFPSDGLVEVNSPIQVLVDGKSADILNKVGWPGFQNSYRVDFRVPDGIAKGMATVQLSVAWIAAPEIKLPIM